MRPEGIELSQTQKDRYRMFSVLCGSLKKKSQSAHGIEFTGDWEVGGGEE